jgi:hypothetical protein
MDPGTGIPFCKKAIFAFIPENLLYPITLFPDYRCGNKSLFG